MKRDDLVVRPWAAYYLGRKIAVAVGRGGIGVKAGEGDGITPIGVWRVENWLIRHDRVTLRGDSIGPFDRWCDAGEHPLYNQLFKHDHQISSERLFRTDRLYDVVGVIDYNRTPIIANKGSAIFIHQWRRARFPTEGCIAFARQDLHWICKNWSDHSRLVIQA